MGTDNFITIFFLVVAVLIFLNLRSVLGKRTGTEKTQVIPRDGVEPGQNRVPSDDGKVITLPRRDTGEPAADGYVVIDDFSKPGSKVNIGLRKVFDADPSFNPNEFVQGAKMAYEMIVTAFADGDRKTLKSLLSSDVYEGFNQAISEREKNGEIMKSTFVGIEKIDIIDAVANATDVSITLRIVSQLISVTYDKDQNVVDGDPDDVADVIDLWTFARDVRSRDPNWKLTSTQAEG